MRIFSPAVALALLAACTRDTTEPKPPDVSVRRDALTNVPVTFKFDDFSNTSLLQLNGTAVTTSNRLRLTDSAGNQAGSFFCKQKISLKNDRSFSTYFRFQMTDGGGSPGFPYPADGMVFVLQPLSNTAGSVGSGIGYGGIGNSLGVEFDTYHNPELGDPNDRHVGTHVNGNMASHLAVASYPNNWGNGSTYHVWIDYNGLTNLLEVRVSENNANRPASALLTQNVELSTVFGVDEVYAGFTAATGGAWAKHWVDSWYFQNDYAPLDLVNNTYVATPTSVVVSASPASNTRSSVITATVKNEDGSIRANWPVTFTTNRGTLSATSATTNDQGQAQVTLTYSGGVATTARVGTSAQGGAYGFADVGLLANPTLTIVSSAGGSVSPGTLVVPYGGNQSFSITPNPGYDLVSLTVDGVGVPPSTSYDFTNVTASHTLSATFAIRTYAITATSGARGAISPSGNQTVAHGSSITFTFTPQAGYRVADVVVDGSSIGTPASHTFSNVSAPHTIVVSFTLIDQPPSLTVTSGATSWTEEAPPVAIDPTLALTDPDGPNLTGAKVSISAGYVASEDRLVFASQSGIDGTFNTATGVLTLTGSASAAAYEAALRSVQYQNLAAGAPDTRARQVTFSIGANSLYNPDNGHFYEFVAAAGISWTQAKSQAASRAYYGKQGYLVTVTSAAENAFVGGKLAAAGWMGASDQAVERQWRWVTGPEGLEDNGAGRRFFDQAASCVNGSIGAPVNGEFNGWTACEPNDFGGNEDFAHFYADGLWNDYPENIGASIGGYVVEYGGMPGDEQPQLFGTRDLEVKALPLFLITTSAGANGSVSPLGASPVKLGKSLSVSITPAANHHVQDVLVDGVSVGAVTSYVFSAVSAPHTLLASFAIDQYQVNVTSGPNGSVSCVSPVDHGQQSECTIVADPGYQLATFTDDGVDRLSKASGGTYFILGVVADHSISATFIKSNGTTCSSSAECGSGSCVDGVCCNTACNGQCESCGVAGSVGTCVAVSGAPVGGRPACGSDGSSCGGTCDGSTRSACVYPTSQCRGASCAAGVQTAAASCDGAGSCPAPVTASCGSYACGVSACATACADDLGCASGFHCAAGACLPNANQGGTCSRDGECGTGKCVDGFCCNAACNGQCEACDVPGSEGVCTPVSGNPHGARPVCDSDGSQCGGQCDGAVRDACSYPGATVSCRAASCSNQTATLAAACDGAGSCPAVQTQACGEYVCGATACLGNCLHDANCAAGNWCSGGVCAPKKSTGAACGADNQCAGGICADGFCCNRACEGQCEACDVAGSEGTCSPVTGAPHAGRTQCASDGSLCAGQCDGVNASACAYPGAGTQCRAPACATGTATLAAACDGAGACPAEQTQACAPFVCGANACLGNCAADSDCAGGNWCSAGVCVAKLANGGTCAADNQCGSGSCVDGFCCNTACGGACEACDVPGSLGTCVAVTGAPHGARPACASDGSLCGGQCDGVERQQCTYPAVECRGASCADGTATLAAACHLGSCPAVQTQACGEYVCGATACLGGCGSDSDCAAGSYCSAGICAQKKQPGAACGVANQCASGACVDGVCCNTACDGQCEACDVPGSVGTCTAVSGAPHGERPACAGAGSSCGGTCDGSDRDACAFPSAQTECVAASCTNGVETHVAKCDGAGQCGTPTTKLCGDYACGQTTCRTECTSNADCASGACFAGQCMDKPMTAPPGQVLGEMAACGCDAGGSAVWALLGAAWLLRRRRGQRQP